MVGIAFLLLLSVQFVSGSKCKFGWQQYGNGCYGYFKRPSMNWIAASGYCSQRFQAQLVEINNTGLNNFLKGLFHWELNKDFSIWMGATARYTKRGMYPYELVWIPSGNPLMPYVNWLPSEPDNPEKEKCALLQPDGLTTYYGWKSEACYKKNSFMCMKPLVGQVCEIDYFPIQGKCYWYRPWGLDWRSAWEKCKTLGADLVEIESPELNTVIGTYLHMLPVTFRSIWIGGSTLFTEGTWVWTVSHRPMQSFVNFSPGEPAGRRKEFGIAMYVKNGKWETSGRKTIQLRFICERHI